MGIIRLILIGVVVYILVSSLLIFYYGIWGLLASLLLLSIVFQVGKRLAGKMLLNLFTTPFRAKGAVLKNADVRVLSVTPAPTPRHEQIVDAPTGLEDAEVGAGGSHDWYYLDVTITPQPSPGPFTVWEPSEMALVGPNANPTPLEDDGSELGTIHSVQIWQDGDWQRDSIGKYEGPQRLKLHIGVRSGERRLRFRYYFEIFGHIELPAPQTMLREPTTYTS